MTVLELKELIADMADTAEVVIPTSNDFDGSFYSPSLDESSTGVVLIDCAEKDVLILVPIGFYTEKDTKYTLN